MNAARLVSLVVIATACALPSLIRADSGIREANKTDLELMQGDWELKDFAYFNQGIRSMPVEDKQQMSGQLKIKANKYRLKLQFGETKHDVDGYTLKLYPDRTPKAFDVTMPEGNVIQGIYEIKGGTLRRCYSQLGTPRPMQFQAGSQTYQLWKRPAKTK